MPNNIIQEQDLEIYKFERNIYYLVTPMELDVRRATVKCCTSPAIHHHKYM